ncbi:AcrR family transcriptional regulator [Rhodococcus sp. 27YEA15]|uniref:TetR/AcrR family transcriptional regulator n=1 Tax=Rhodococcus sp. 27YEA15 TaxID=3156259 RepID=UPI003C7C800C
MHTEQSPTPSRRDRPAKPALTRDGIVSTAVNLLRAYGMQKVTMRRLALELDTGAASLYVYVKNTAELHAAVLDELLGEVDLGENTSGTWQEQLEHVLTSYTSVLFEYPSLAQAAMVARPSGPHYLQLIERLLALLDDGDVPVDRASWGVDLLLQHATATAAEHTTRDSTIDAGDDWDALTDAVENADARVYPQIAAHAAHLLSGEPEHRLSWSFRMLVTGITNTPLTPQESS